MTIAEAINAVDTLKPNVYTQTQKIAWLNTIDGYINEEIHKKYKDPAPFSGYTSNTPTTTELLVPSPWDELYLYGLESKIDYYNQEERLFNNSNAMFLSARQAYADNYNANHDAIHTNINFF